MALAPEHISQIEKAITAKGPKPYSPPQYVLKPGANGQGQWVLPGQGGQGKPPTPGAKGKPGTPPPAAKPPAAKPNPPASPYLTPAQQLSKIREQGGYENSHASLVRALSDLVTRTNFTEYGNQQAAAKGTERTNSVMAGRGLFNSSITQNAVQDIQSTLTTRNSILDTALATARIDNARAMSNLETSHIQNQNVFNTQAVANAQAIPPSIPPAAKPPAQVPAAKPPAQPPQENIQQTMKPLEPMPPKLLPEHIQQIMKPATPLKPPKQPTAPSGGAAPSSGGVSLSGW